MFWFWYRKLEMAIIINRHYLYAKMSEKLHLVIFLTFIIIQ